MCRAGRAGSAAGDATLFAGGVGGDALCDVLDVPELMLLCLSEVSEAMRCVLICMLEVPEVMRSVPSVCWSRLTKLT